LTGLSAKQDALGSEYLMPYSSNNIRLVFLISCMKPKINSYVVPVFMTTMRTSTIQYNQFKTIQKIKTMNNENEKMSDDKKSELKKEMTLSERLRNMPYSNDRVGQAFSTSWSKPKNAIDNSSRESESTINE
jgi:hypothetical protein